VKPAPFGYHRAGSVREAVRLLSAYEGAARVIAGGQSLVPMLNMRLLRPDALVDLNDVAELTEIRADATSTRIGSMVRYTMLERSPVVRERLPLLAAITRYVGDRQVRNRGTIGGSLAQGDPTGEIPLACLALGARAVVNGPDGSREIPVAALYRGSYASVLDPCEVITEVAFPPAPRRFAFAEHCRRHNDFAVVSVAVVGDRGPTGIWSNVCVVLGGVAETPVRATRAGDLLSGCALSDDEVRAAAAAALDVADPPSDVRASAGYRRHLAEVYVRRVLTALRTGPAETSGPADGPVPGPTRLREDTS
jgi:carbon-monoxide dehydrogenase medium subunit